MKLKKRARTTTLSKRLLYFSFAINLALIVVIGFLLLSQRPVRESVKREVYTNEEYLEGLGDGSTNISDPLSVFELVFSKLGEVVDVYPTENYYYFTFVQSGREFGGALLLFPEFRDNGSIGIGYSERSFWSTAPLPAPLAGGWKVVTKQDGLDLQKIDDFTYKANFRGKSTIFRLNKLPLEPGGELYRDEEYVGPVFDESGLAFDLVFNRKLKKLYYVLNEKNSVPLTFQNISQGSGLLERRTGFVFYNDSEINRKLLIGVANSHVYHNDWFDGPFDQLPDNYVSNGEIELGSYFAQHFNMSEARLDRFGKPTDWPSGTRMALSPYLVYFAPEEFYYLPRCELKEKAWERYQCVLFERGGGQAQGFDPDSPSA
ncbi:hypothetical protein D6817_01270 [Candidatus Pacearchaeota archaeon]|nr:MAG: hypothetical protein D6817_01270 [Candidatus Pacearchaeota archaeon]